MSEDSIRHQLPGYDPIDPVNWVTRTIPTAGGPLTVSGITVRQLRAILSRDTVDDDDLVLYAFEVPEGVTGLPPLMLGPIAGVASGSSEGLHVTMMFGPEAIDAIKAASKGRNP